MQDVPFVVASGSLSAGISEDFYARVAQIATRANAKVVIDSLGRPLAAALEEGVYLIKNRAARKVIHGFCFRPGATARSSSCLEPSSSIPKPA